MKYAVTSIKSGDDSAGTWVSVGYRSKNSEQHVLHIVGGEETTAQPVGRTLVPIYFERDDQSLSCYEGADRILVTDSSITLTLNKNGRDSLERCPKRSHSLPKNRVEILKRPRPYSWKFRNANLERSSKLFSQMKKPSKRLGLHSPSQDTGLKPRCH